MTVGERIKQLRDRCGLSQEAFGEICGVTKGMVSQWEKNDVMPPVQRMINMRKKINFSLDWLYCEDGELRPALDALLKVAEPLPDYAVSKLTKEGLSYAELIVSATKDESNHGSK